MGRRRKLTLPAEWEEFGARWGDDGLLYFSEWRKGFTVHELRALFWQCQEVAALRSDLKQARADLERLQGDLDRWRDRAAYYRALVRHEAHISALFPPPR